MNKLRVGVVGVGYLGQFHAQKYAAMANADLIAVVDIDRSRAQTIAAQLQTKALYDHRQLIDQVEAVSIVTPTPTHFDISRFFLEHNIDVFIEKPITTTLEEADALIKLAEDNGLIIQVGHLERFNSAVVALQQIATEPKFIESHRLSTYKGRGTDVSVVLDLMIHDIDIILNFVKSDIQIIRAAGIPVISPNVDIANARLEFANGCVANVTASRISAKEMRKIRLFQREAYISMDFAHHEITVIQKDPSQVNGVIPGLGIQRLCFTKGDALEEELLAFVHAVSNRQVPEVTGQMGRRALKIALSIMDQIHAQYQHLQG